MATPRKDPKDYLKRGRPSEYDPKFHPESFIALSRQGNNLKEIANEWGIYKDTIHSWAKQFPEFSSAVQIGRQACEVWYSKIGKSAMLGQARTIDGQKVEVDFKYYKWMTQNVCKWSERVHNEALPPTTTKDDSDDIELPKNGTEAIED